MLQLNAGSITGQFGSECRSIAAMLLNLGYVQLVASDAHGAIGRTPDMQNAYELVGAQYSFEYADILFNENPLRVLNDRRLLYPMAERPTPANADYFLTDEEYWGI